MRVLFIAGYARSGTTILDRLLGTVPGVTSMGEIQFLWRRGLAENRPCGCGILLRGCPFWSEVLRSAFGQIGDVELGHILRLQRAADRWWRVPALSSGRGGRRLRAAAEEYAAILATLVQAVAAVSGSRVVVDSSKDASHGLLLARAPGLDVRVLHLVRDPRGVAYSLAARDRVDPGLGKRMPTQPVVHTAFAWSVANMQAMQLRHAASAYTVLSYEEMTRDPAAALARAARFVGMPNRLAVGTDGTVQLGVDHTAAGNPMRFHRGPIRITPDMDWVTEMPRLGRAFVWSVTGAARGRLADAGVAWGQLPESRTAAGSQGRDAWCPTRPRNPTPR